MGLRKERLADQIRDILASYFLGGRLNDPRLDQVSITAVKLSGDFQVASVYFRVYDLNIKEKAQRGLNHAKGLLRKHLANSLKIRRIPEIRFFYDDSIENAERIERLLAQIEAEKK